MPRITTDEVRKTAALARLALQDEEVERLRGELEAMLDYIALLQSLDTTGTLPQTHAVPFDAPLRADEVAPALSIEEVLAGAPRRNDRFFEVPRIIRAGAPAGATTGTGGRSGEPR